MTEEIIEEITDWRGQAEALFFVDHLSIVEIEKILHKSRRHISLHLQASIEYDYEAEREWRKQQNISKRKEYKREWDSANRAYTAVTGDTLRREHEEAVKVLSHEKYY